MADGVGETSGVELIALRLAGELVVYGGYVSNITGILQCKFRNVAMYVKLGKAHPLASQRLRAKYCTAAFETTCRDSIASDAPLCVVRIHVVSLVP